LAQSISRNVIRAIGSAVTRSGNHARLSILIYHRVLLEPDPMLQDEIDANVFRTHMDALADVFNVLPLREAVQRLGNGTLPSRAACITFDDGYLNNATVALPILQERSLPACFFIATEFLDGGCMWNDIVIEALRNATIPRLDLTDIDLGDHIVACLEDRLSAMTKLLPALKKLNPESRAAAVDRILVETGVQRPTGMMMTPAQVKSLVDAGMEIGGHTVSHPILSVLTQQQARAEIASGKERLEAITGHSVKLFAYPNGRPGHDFTEAHIALCKELGFVAAVTTARGTARQDTNPFLLPRFTPWDRTPTRFTLRLYQNALLNIDSPD
jgi:peptidoglycan/xylan/chitin deacetylase (PgdA/CDA1 family)